MDKDIGDTKVEGLYKSLQAAINDATPGTIIKVAPNLYEEAIVIEYFTSNNHI